MKTVRYSEFWYVLVLGAAGCLLAGPLGFYSYRAFTSRSHDAVLGWPPAIAALLLWSWAAWCCFWEYLLLQMRRWEPGRSETTPLVVFGSGLVALLIAFSLAVYL